MDLKTRHSIVLSFLLSFLLLAFCLLIYGRVKSQLELSAQQSLAAFLEHEWNHVQHKNGEVSAPSNTLFHKDIFYKLTRNGKTVFNSLPPSTFPESSQLTRIHGLNLKVRKSLGGSEFELTGNYDLSTIFGYLRTLKQVLILGASFAVILIAGVSWFMIRSILAPFQTLSLRTRQLDAAKLSFRFEKPKYAGEYGLLVESFNSLLSRLERSFSSLRRFATNSSHELKTPLAIMRGETELLLRRSREPWEYQKGLNSIATQIDSLNDLIARLLFFSDLERLEQETASNKISVPSLLRRSIPALCKMNGVEESKVTLDVKPDEVFIGKTEILSSIVNNLIDNAIKFSTSQVRITSMLENNEFSFRVDDDGPGIPPEKMGIVTEPLTQMRPVSLGNDALASLSSEKLRRASHGLGLAIVMTCVEAMQGTVRFFESPLGGLAVEVRLPQPG